MIEAVLDALRQVIDPELDESIVELGFVDQVNVRGDAVEVVLRLPTFWCAPNFAYLMAHDTREAIKGLPGIASVQVNLRDHAYSDEISVGVSCGKSFGDTFAGQTEDEDLEALRLVFWRKAFGMRQEQSLLRQYLVRRQRLGLGNGPLIMDVDGRLIAAAGLGEHLQRTRRERVSMTFNSLMCRGLLDTRYGLESARKEEAR